ncbi:MAG: type II toxin-antitoxin system VapC family toxin [Spirochaetaceae bacterium]|nr:MAG: type II toxin-antitoxin system VapC family toxin [Spirochaetaceae bacterium]
MTVLLDTHCWLWWIAEPARLSDSSLDLIRDPSNRILISSATTWEIAIKYSIGKLALPEPPDRFVPSRIERDRLEPLPVLHSHTLRTASLPYHHRDPFDRLLIAQALVEEIPILTDDAAFDAYEVRTLRP